MSSCNTSSFYNLFDSTLKLVFFLSFFSDRVILLTFVIFSAGFVLYAILVLIAVFILVYYYIPSYGQTHIMCYIGVCSLVGSLSVCIISRVYFFTRCLWYIQLSYLVQILFFSGNERESYWHCFEAYIIRNESASISPDMGFHFHCFDLHHHSNELFKQGN